VLVGVQGAQAKGMEGAWHKGKRADDGDTGDGGPMAHAADTRPPQNVEEAWHADTMRQLGDMAHDEVSDESSSIFA
jgi:hypothetical protein